jgi:hypothetical protein
MAGGGMMMMLMSVLDGLAQLLVALIPLAIWQRTKVVGFALVAASYAGGAVLMMLGPWLFSATGYAQATLLAWRLVGFALTALAAYGFWRIYRALRAPPVAASTEGG